MGDRVTPLSSWTSMSPAGSGKVSPRGESTSIVCVQYSNGRSIQDDLMIRTVTSAKTVVLLMQSLG